jgi:cytochrome c oxidase subunit II
MSTTLWFDLRRQSFALAFVLPVWLVLLYAPAARSQTNPQTPVEIKVIARKFEFDPRTVTVQKGKAVRLVITSADVDHGFKLEELGINQKIPAHKTINVDFTPNQVGRFEFKCSVVCGDGHDDMLGELVVTEAAPQKVNVTFDDKTPGVAIVEVNGEQVRIDTTTRTWTRVEQQAKSEPSNPLPQNAGEGKQPVAEAEPYDYRLVNVPTPKRVLKGSLNLYFTHRFSQPVRPLNQSAKELIGLDSSAVPSFGLFYGITDKLYVDAYRSAICQRGLCRTIEIGAGYHFLDEQKQHSPIALSGYASIEGDDNFTQNFTYNLQVMLARSVTRYVNLFFSPAVHFNANGQRRFDPRANDFFPPATVDFHLPKHTGSFGFGVNGRITPSVSLLFEYTPRVGFKLGAVLPVFDSTGKVIGFTPRSEAEIGFGVQKDVGRHSFSLTFSNTQTTTTSRYNSSNLVLPPSRFIIGFNLYRRFLR